MSLLVTERTAARCWAISCGEMVISAPGGALPSSMDFCTSAGLPMYCPGDRLQADSRAASAATKPTRHIAAVFLDDGMMLCTFIAYHSLLDETVPERPGKA